MSQFGSHLNALDRYLRRCRREYMAPFGLRGLHARMFLAIARTPGCSQDQLSKRMGFDKSTVARQLEDLENKGFVTRQPSEKHKRMLCVYPTEAMGQILPGLCAATKQWEDVLLQDLTEDEKQVLVDLLTRLHARADKEA